MDIFDHSVDDFYAPYYNRDKHYGYSIALIQSSGSGKSRFVEELKSKVSFPDKLRFSFIGTD